MLGVASEPMRSSRLAASYRALVVLSLSLCLAPVGCGQVKQKQDQPKADAKADDGGAQADDAGPPADSGPMVAGSSGAAAGTGGAQAGEGSGGAAAGSSGGAGAAVAASEGGGTGGAGSSGAADSTGGAEAGGAAEEAGGSTGGPDVTAMLKQVTSTRTKDKPALEVLAEAEEAGAELLDMARAANDRGEKLYASPERAKVFFEWANDKDPSYPLPAFNLAKQAAVLGELEEAKTWLKVVHERKGNKLLKQIEFDPMWEILKDDPDVQALLK